MQLDLARLESVHCFCQQFLRSGSRLDLLVNNAGSCCLLGPAPAPPLGGGLQAVHVNASVLQVWWLTAARTTVSASSSESTTWATSC